MELEEKFNARYKLWFNLDKFGKQKLQWLEKNFDELDTTKIGMDMKKFMFEVGTLKSDIKLLNDDERDGVLDYFIGAYKNIE